MQSKKQSIPPGKTVININGCHTNEDKEDRCGYCKGRKGEQGAQKWGITSHKMSVQDYQKLMDRGWRRCGGYYYKYDFQNSCCQPYTIRIEAKEYQISHSQRKVMKRFNKFLLGEIDMEGKSTKNQEKMDLQKTQQQQNQDLDKQEKLETVKTLQQDIIKDTILKLVQSSMQDLMQYQELLNELVKTSIISKPKDKKLKDTLSFSTNVLIKLFYKLKELKINNLEHISQNLKQFVEFLRKIENIWENLQLKTHIEDSGYLTFINMEKDEIQIEEIKQQQIKSKKENKEKQKNESLKHQQEEEKKSYEKDSKGNQNLNNEDFYYQQYFKEHVPLELKPGQELKHKYSVKITKALSSEESFKVYSQYQDFVHKESEKSILGYQRFLCNNPLFDPRNKKEADFECPQKLKDYDDIRDLKDEGIFPEYFGGYHMIHKIDEEIIAVGVLDFTPSVLSSVYLYYNPKYEFLNPGTFTAVREIEYVQRVQEVFDHEFKYYYMGYYFQDCQKSVYKGTYKPSQVLCPVTYNYVYLTDEVRQKIDKEKLPKLCMDKPKIKELDLSNQQVELLSKNFKFYYKNSMLLTVNDLSPQYVDLIFELVKHLYQQLGLDLIMTCAFTI